MLELYENNGLKLNVGLRKGIRNIFAVAVAKLRKQPPPPKE
jgi:hypothetical protein